jgi:hypothetical protein
MPTPAGEGDRLVHHQHLRWQRWFCLSGEFSHGLRNHSTCTPASLIRVTRPRSIWSPPTASMSSRTRPRAAPRPTTPRRTGWRCRPPVHVRHQVDAVLGAADPPTASPKDPVAVAQTVIRLPSVKAIPAATPSCGAPVRRSSSSGPVALDPRRSCSWSVTAEVLSTWGRSRPVPPARQGDPARLVIGGEPCHLDPAVVVSMTGAQCRLSVRTSAPSRYRGLRFRVSPSAGRVTVMAASSS